MNHPIHIAIPTHGRPDLLQRTLESLAACRIPSSLVQTIVIENGGQNGAKAVVAAASPQLKPAYRFTPVGNKSHALNVVLEDLRDGLVVFFDDDIRLQANVLDAYAAAAKRYGEGHFFGGPFGVDYEEEPPEWLKQYLSPCALGWEPAVENWEPDGTTTFYGCNWAAFSVDLKNAGGFNTKVGPGCNATGQESDMQIKLRSADVTPQYLPDAKVWHYVPANRCSPQWVIERTARVMRGMAAIKQNQGTSRLRRLRQKIGFHVEPRWIRHRLNSHFSTNEESKFYSRYQLIRRKTMLESAVAK